MATTITAAEADVPIDLLPMAENGGDPIGEDLIGYSDDEYQEVPGERAVSSKAGMLDLPGAVDISGPDAELGVDLIEPLLDTDAVGLEDGDNLDVLDESGTWDLQADVDATFERSQAVEVRPDAEGINDLSSAADHLDNEYGTEDFGEAHLTEDVGESTAFVDRPVDPAFSQGNSTIPPSLDEQDDQEAEDLLHEIDYDEEGQTTSQYNDALTSQALDNGAQDHDDTVSQDMMNPFAGAEVVDDAESSSHKNDQETDTSRQDSRSIEDRVLDEALYGDSSAASLDTPMGGGDLPEVIVSWHGVDYPLLYDSPGSEGKQCFFEDANLLHCAMEELLSNFRRELSDDLSPTDELVLQVNEMGLEFAESSNPDNFRDITLDSVLQVFNDLVKNKDPDASRPLYAYLITRPSCNSRWQALIEDAYQGKNIDEVSICFPGGQNATSVMGEFADESEVAGESDEEDQGMGDSAEPDGNVNRPPQDESRHGHEEEDLNDDEDEQFSQGLDEYGVNDDSEVGDGLDEYDRDDLEPRAAHSPEPASTTVQLESTVDPRPSEQVVGGPNNTTTGYDDAGAEHDALLEDEGNDEAVGKANVEEDGDARSQPQDAVEVSETGEVYLETETDTARGDVHDPDFADERSAFDAEEPDETKVTSDTSATATLDGDEDADNLNGEFDFDANIGQGAEETDAPLVEDNAGDLDEIDWRDYADQGDEETPQGPAMASTKRPRSDEDDLADAEYEQDVKRRRSDA